MTDRGMLALSFVLATRGVIAAPNDSGKVLVRRRLLRDREHPLLRNLTLPTMTRPEQKLGSVDLAPQVGLTALRVSTEWPLVNDTIVMSSSFHVFKLYCSLDPSIPFQGQGGM